MEEYLKNLQAWFWRYGDNERNYDGFHFTAKPEACDALEECVWRLVAQAPAKRTIPLPALLPEDERKVTGGMKYREFRTLVLKSSAEQADQVVLTTESDRITLSLAPEGANLFVSVLHEVRAGRGDTGLSVVVDPTATKRKHREGNLWYWPCFGHLWPIE